MNARYVGLTPYAEVYSFFSFSRICTTLDMSTSIALVTCAEVSSERRMCSAIPRRIADMGSKLSPGPGSPATAGACATGAGAGCAGAAAGCGSDGACGAAGGSGGGRGGLWGPTDET